MLVTGVNGFVGKHLARELKEQGDEIIGVGREDRPSSELKGLLADYYICDLMDQAAVAKLPLEGVNVVISLAGLARVGDSFAEPEKYKAVNVGVLTNLLAVLADRELKPRVIAISTGTVYDPNQPLPLNEESKLVKNGSPYTLSKIAMEQAAQEFRNKGQDIIIVRPFNHIGPGQEEGFLVPDLFAKLKAAKDSGNVIKVGNLATKRDYTDVRDVVKAYASLAHARGLIHAVYNVCSGKSVAGKEILGLLLQLTSLEVKVETDTSLLRPNDILDIYGSYQRLQAEIDWQPQIPLRKTLEDFVKTRG